VRDQIGVPVVAERGRGVQQRLVHRQSVRRRRRGQFRLGDEERVQAVPPVRLAGEAEHGPAAARVRVVDHPGDVAAGRGPRESVEAALPQRRGRQDDAGGHEVHEDVVVVVRRAEQFVGRLDVGQSAAEGLDADRGHRPRGRGPRSGVEDGVARHRHHAAAPELLAEGGHPVYGRALGALEVGHGVADEARRHTAAAVFGSQRTGPLVSHTV
jgi:hypothetical protein